MAQGSMEQGHPRVPRPRWGLAGLPSHTDTQVHTYPHAHTQSLYTYVPTDRCSLACKYNLQRHVCTHTGTHTQNTHIHIRVHALAWAYPSHLHTCTEARAHMLSAQLTLSLSSRSQATCRAVLPASTGGATGLLW